MPERKVKLGDVVDDYCPRCRLMMNHGVMAIEGEAIRKVRCNTCMNEHPYRHGKPPKRKKDPVRDAYEQLLGKIPKHGGSGGASGGGGGRVPLPGETAGEEPEEE